MVISWDVFIYDPRKYLSYFLVSLVYLIEVRNLDEGVSIIAKCRESVHLLVSY